MEDVEIYRNKISNKKGDNIEFIVLRGGLQSENPRLFMDKIVSEIDTEGVLHVHGEVGKDSIDFEMKIKGVKDKNELEKSVALLSRSNVQ